MSDTTFLVNDRSEPIVVVVGTRGPAGTSNPVLQAVAATSIGGQRVVLLNASGQVIYADNDDVSHADRVEGITTGAVAAGSGVTIRTAGEMTEPSWSWTPGARLFLSGAGFLSEVPPATGFVQQIAHAVTATKIIIRIHPSYLR